MPDLLVAKPDGSLLHTRPVTPRTTVVVGRSPQCGIVVPSERASRHHAVIFEFAGSWYAVDLDSTAGLQIEAGPVRLHQFTPESAWVRMGPVVLWIDGLQPSRAVSPPTLPTPISLKREPVVRIREDFVTPPPPPPASDAPSLLVAFRRRHDDALRLVDLVGADRAIVGGDPRADIVIPEDAAPMRSLFFRVGSKWAAVDLADSTSPGEEPGHRRLSPGGRLALGPVEATIVAADRVIRHAEDESEDTGFDPFDVPDLGSIFTSKPGESGGDGPVRPQNR